MFTGIVTDLGRVRAIEERGDRRFVFATGYPAEALVLGASISCSGVCLTVVESGPLPAAEGEGAGSWFAADVSAETLSKTTLGGWQEGMPVNFERALKVGDELGGHLVSGHVDGVARVLERRTEGDSQRFLFEAPAALSPFIAPKGSIALDGVSLTVNEVTDEAGGACRFGVNIVPHTAAVTSFGTLEAGGRVNLEIDLVARYLQRLTETRD